MPVHLILGKRKFDQFLEYIVSVLISTLWAVYVNSVLASLNFRAYDKSGSPAIPVGKHQTPTVVDISMVSRASFHPELGRKENESGEYSPKVRRMSLYLRDLVGNRRANSSLSC